MTCSQCPILHDLLLIKLKVLELDVGPCCRQLNPTQDSWSPKPLIDWNTGSKSPLIMGAQKTVLLLQSFHGLKCVCESCFKLFSVCVLKELYSAPWSHCCRTGWSQAGIFLCGRELSVAVETKLQADFDISYQSGSVMLLEVPDWKWSCSHQAEVLYNFHL